MRTFAAMLAVAAAAAGCTVSETNPPALAGPSELGLSLTLAARPDVLSQDGSAQAQILIQAKDPSSQPVRNLDLRVEITIAGQIADYGTLSPGRYVRTGSDGSALVTYTPPPASLLAMDSIITLAVTPVGADYRNVVPRTVDIRLVPPGVITGTGAPKADFLFSPTAPGTGAVVQFDASISSASPGQTIDVYTWDFGDGDRKVVNGSATTTHDFLTARTFAVSLTVTDSGGSTHTVTKPVTIS